MMHIEIEESRNGKLRRNHYDSREAWHTACEVFVGHLCHYCEERSEGAPLCAKCQRSLLQLLAAGKDLGICDCPGVEEWFFEYSGAYEQPSEELESQAANNENMPDTLVAFVERIDTSKTVKDTADSIVLL